MARVTGPALSVEALGPLGGALTFSRTQGGRVAKLTPRRTNRPSRQDRATRAIFQFAQRDWTNGLIPNFGSADWSQLAAQKNLPLYNTFISDALEQTRQGLAPRVSPITPSGTPPSTIGALTAKTFRGGMTIQATITVLNNGYGIYVTLKPHPLDPTTVLTIAGSIDQLIDFSFTPTSWPIKNLPHGSTWYAGAIPFDLDGNLGIEVQSFIPIVVP